MKARRKLGPGVLRVQYGAIQVGKGWWEKTSSINVIMRKNVLTPPLSATAAHVH